MGFFDPNAGGGNNGGGGIPFTDITLKDKVQITDADGNILTALPLSERGKGTYTRTLTAENIGQNGLSAQFKGSGRFAGGASDSFNTHVADANGNNATMGKFQGVTQIVAGPGLYISSPNGQGVVTVSTQPLQTSVNTDTLFDICWTEAVDSPYGSIGQFTAVGMGGASASSRDGHNWVHMKPFTDCHAIIGVSTEINSNIPDNHLEYNGVSTGGKSYYGRAGINGDAIYTATQLSDQNGPISQTFVSTFIFSAAGTNSSGGGGGGGGGGGTTGTTGTYTILFDDANNFGASLAYTPFQGATDSSDCSVILRTSSNWATEFGLGVDYQANGAYSGLPVTPTYKFNGTSFTPASGGTFAIGDINTDQDFLLLTNPINTFPQQPSVKGKVFDANLVPFTFTQGQANTITVILTFTDHNGTVYTINNSETATWN